MQALARNLAPGQSALADGNAGTRLHSLDREYVASLWRCGLPELEQDPLASPWEQEMRFNIACRQDDRETVIEYLWREEAVRRGFFSR